MGKRYGRCVNFGMCPNADTKEVIEVVDPQNFTCPECNSNLVPAEPGGGGGTGAKKVALIALVIAALAAGGFLFWPKSQPKPTPQPAKTTTESKDAKTQLPATQATPPPNPQEAPKPPEPPKVQEHINLSLDQWIGWRPILMANGGLETKKGSIFDRLGLKVSIKNIDDNDAKLSALMAGKLDAMGSTINRYAFELPKLQRANIPAKMVLVSNTSSGGDGIIAKKNIKRIEDLAGKKVALARFTEAQCLLEWCLINSSLSPQQIDGIRRNIIFTDDAGKAGEVFFSGNADAAATWQPFLTQSQTSTDGHILIDTKKISNFILDGIIFREEFIKTHRTTVVKFVQGVLEATDALTSEPRLDPDTEYSYLMDSFPMCANLKKKEIEDMFPDAKLSNYSDNMYYFHGKDGKEGIAEQVFAQSSRIWVKLGETANPDLARTAFDSSMLDALSSLFKKEEKQEKIVTQQERKKAEMQPALMTKRLTINFETGSANILPESYPVLSEFAVVAKMAENTAIQIEGNTDNVGSQAANQVLSEKRARSVAAYLHYQGINPTRFIVIGNGITKPIAENTTEQGRAQNRRTDVMFKSIE